MSVAEFRVSDRYTALPAEARRRWTLKDGGSVEAADLGDALLIVPAGRAGCARRFAERSKRPADIQSWPAKWRLMTRLPREPRPWT